MRGNQSQKLAKQKLIRMYRRMQEIRQFEEKLYRLFSQGIMPGTMHQYTGEEAIAVGVCEVLRPEDYITSTHRGHGHYIAKGGSLKKLMAELFAKKTGCCKGMGGSMHIMDYEKGILCTTAIVGAGIPLAVGAALSAKMRNTDQVVACFFGDGAANQGTFHEGLNLAAIWELPVIFVCENNFYAVSTSISRVMKVEKIADRSSAYGIPGVCIDGNDVLEVYAEANKAVERARGGGGSTLLECRTYRHRGHARFDSGDYRPREELEEWLLKDPISRFRQYLTREGILTEEEMWEIDEEVTAEIQEAVSFAEESSDVEEDGAFRYVFAK